MSLDPHQLVVYLLCLLRCLVPVLLLLGISYLLRRLGWLSSDSEDDDSTPSGKR